MYGNGGGMLFPATDLCMQCSFIMHQNPQSDVLHFVCDCLDSLLTDVGVILPMPNDMNSGNDRRM